MHKNQPAFTLIELSIVLVIIGLIVGGVLVGQDLIAASKQRQVISKLGDLTTFVNAFKLKYNCLPGDCKNASTFGLGANGNGDKIITGPSEDFNSIVHLNSAGYIASATGSEYLPDLCGQFSLFHSDQSLVNLIAVPSGSLTASRYLYAHCGIGTNRGGSIDYCNGLYNIDSKTDDEVPHTGRTLTYPIIIGGSAVTICVNGIGPASTYNYDAIPEGANLAGHQLMYRIQ